MKIIPNLEALNNLEDQELVKFIKESSPWLSEGWDAESIGYVFCLDEEDSYLTTQICCVPHIPYQEEAYRNLMTIDFTSFEDWEFTTYDEQIKYYQAVALLGSAYGADIYMSMAFVQSVPNLKMTLDRLIEKEKK